MISPKFLKQGSLVGITCPAGYVSQERIAYAIKVLESWGFSVRPGKTVGTAYYYFSGTDEKRLADLQAMMDDPDMDAILMGRGGYGMSRIVDALDLSGFAAKPKWICGFSDITVLHSHVESRLNVASLHSPMCGAFKLETEQEAYLKTLYAALTGAPVIYHTRPEKLNRYGIAKAPLTGGNLSLLTHLIGSASEVDTAGKILFIEDIGEHLYKIDRMMLTLKRAGKLQRLAGLILGGFTDLEDTDRPFGQTVEEIIWDKVKEYDYPVCFGFPAGHMDVNYTLTLGAIHHLEVTANGVVLELKRTL